MSAQTQAQQAPPPSDDAATITRIEVILVAGASAGYSLIMLRRLLVPLGVAGVAIEAAYKISKSSPTATGLVPAVIRYRRTHPGSTLGVGFGNYADHVVDPVTHQITGSAVAATRKAEITYRAAYLLNAARRLSEAMRGGKSLTAAMARERSNWAAHLDARDRRLVAAAEVDNAARVFGSELGWYAVKDFRTSDECRAADGHNFDVGVRPVIGYPGTVHPHCRCKAGAPFEGAKMVDQRMVGRVGAARPTLRRNR